MIRAEVGAPRCRLKVRRLSLGRGSHGGVVELGNSGTRLSRPWQDSESTLY
jgi:hypothetical protein